MSQSTEQMALAPAETRALTAADQQQTLLQTVMQAVQNPDIDPARLREFLQIGRELEADKAKREWAVAFRAAKDEIDGIRITKRGEIVYPAKKPGQQDTVIKFARYDDVAEVVKPVLRKHQLTASYTYRTEATPPKTICVLTLLHASGHSQIFESVPLPMVDSGGGKSDIQGAGSVMTYGRRYAIQAAFDIVADGQDDDGNMGRDQPGPITDVEIQTITDILQECDSREPGAKKRFTAWMVKELKVEQVKDLRQGAQLKSIMTALDQKQRQLGMK